MANEITILDVPGSGTNAYSARILFRYDITSPVIVSGNTVVESFSSDLPYMAALALTQSEKSALDTGSSAFEIKRYHYNESATTVQIVNFLRGQYSTSKAAFDTYYERRYRYLGQRINSV